MKIERFEELEAWKEARELVNLIYRLTSRETFTDRDLMRQMRRAAVSPMSNIAEGFSRYTIKDSKQFYITARSSLAELRSQAYVALDQAYWNPSNAATVQGQERVVGQLVSGLIRNARKQLAASTTEPLNH